MGGQRMAAGAGGQMTEGGRERGGGSQRGKLRGGGGWKTDVEVESEGAWCRWHVAGSEGM